MGARTPHGEVRFKVQRNALLLGEFTIAQLVHATGLNPESVRTEVQRLRQKGLVISQRIPGKREALYRLSDDPEKRLALSRSVEAFYPEPAEPASPRPTSRLYQIALHSLDRAENTSGDEREVILKEAAHQLEGAWQAEGASRAPKPVQAHILRERGRLSCLQGEPKQAKDYFVQAKEIFIKAGMEGEILLTDDYILWVEIQHQLIITGFSDDAARARRVLELLDAAEHFSRSPIARLLADLMRPLSQTTEATIAEAVYTSMENVAQRIVGEVRSELQSERAMSQFRESPRMPHPSQPYEQPPFFEETSDFLKQRQRKLHA